MATMGMEIRVANHSDLKYVDGLTQDLRLRPLPLQNQLDNKLHSVVVCTVASRIK